jgi:hypothetical protein
MSPRIKTERGRDNQITREKEETDKQINRETEKKRKGEREKGRKR